MDREEINKSYLAPDYDPIEDDDEDDDDFDEDIDEDGEEEALENFLDKQENFNKNNSSSNMSVGSTFGSNNAPNWGQPSTPSWGSNTPSWGSSGSNAWGSNSNQPGSGFWGSNNNNSSWQRPSNSFWGSGSSEKKEINRKKRVIICDVLDCLVETYQSNGKPGLLPRGIYDIKLRFDVWDKIACFNPEKVFAIVPRSLLNSSNGSDSWKVMLDYIVCSFSEYLRSPYQVCQILLQTRIGQPKEELIYQVLNSNIVKEDIIHLGVNSGLYGQNNKDQVASERCGIDYIDLGTFMNSYF